MIVEEDGSSSSLSFEEIFRRSNQVAAWLMRQGVQKGDSVVLMLGNQVELWDCMLGLMKLGAVVMPTAAAVSGAELADRIARADVKFVICDPSDTAKFDDAPGDYIKISVREVQGWRPLADAYRFPDDVRVPHPETDPADRLLLYFTSGTTSRPKLVEHTQVSYPVGHLSTLYYFGLRPGDVHLNISSPGWAKHAWSSFFTPWIAEATVFVYNYARFDAKALLEQIRMHGVTTFCAPPTVWRMLINADLSGGRGSLREVLGAGEPLNPEVIDQVRKHWGLEIRDGYGQTETTAQIGNPPGIPIKIGSMGRPLPGVPVVLVDPATGTRVAGTGEGEICLELAQHPVNFMRGYLDDEARNAEATHGGLYHTGDVATVRRTRLHHVRRPHGRRLQSIGLQDQPVRGRISPRRAPRGPGGGGRAGSGFCSPRSPEGVHRARPGPRSERRYGALHPALRQGARAHRSRSGGTRTSRISGGLHLLDRVDQGHV